MTTRTRAGHLREILGHLDALVDDLDDVEHHHRHSLNWNEPRAKRFFRETRKSMEKCLLQEWAKEGDK